MKKLLLGLVLLAGLTAGGGALLNTKASALAIPAPVIVADQADACTKGFFGLRPWYYYMGNELDNKCGVKCFNIFVQAQGNPNECGETKSDIPGIALAIIDDLLRVAGLVAIFFVIMGAFEYVASRGNAERAASAQSTILAALTGLAISLVAVAFISFLGNRLS
jgi:hypothetical protein